MQRLQFTIRNLLLSTFCIAIGLALATLPQWLLARGEFSAGILLYWFLAGPLIGFGVLTPVKRPVLGLVLGFIVQFIAAPMIFSFWFE